MIGVRDPRWRRRIVGVAGVLALVGALPAAAQSARQESPALGGSWIVQLAEPALASYTGGIAGLAPTSPRVTGDEALSMRRPASVAYLGYLKQRQARFVDRAGRLLGRPLEVTFQYLNVLNGLAVRVDAAGANRLADLPGVAGVYRDEVVELDTDVSHELIGSAAIWNGDTAGGVASRGEGVLMGMLDTGVNPEHPSFAAVDGDGYTHTNPFGSGVYVGVCDPEGGRYDSDFPCNDKLVGAWNFHSSSATARDEGGHGSHTGSTMAGNRHQATVTIGQEQFTRTVQGVAPRANVISYKVCSPTCPFSAILAGVAQAVADGVEVLNYSISGFDNPWQDPVELAFLDAFNAGVFVSASAGNSGPDASTVAHTSPWVASVAASTHQRVFAQTAQVTGPEPVPAGLQQLPAVPGEDRAPAEPIEAPVRDAAVVDPGNVRGCVRFPGGVFAGAIALIDRGDCVFADKVNFAVRAGAVAVVVVNNVAGPPVGMGQLDTTTRPSVMLDRPSGQALRAFMAEQDPDEVTLRLVPDTQMLLDPQWENIMAGFSSRGPSFHNLLAPTYTAPGVNILAAGHGSPDNYLVLQGTSMAAPHGAGAAALLKALHPGWSPAQIRSALVGTADPTRLVAEDGQTPAGVFDQGAGLLALGAAARVGLAMDETGDNFAAGSNDPTQLNVPGMVDKGCAQHCTWPRTLTNVAETTATYTAVVDAPGQVQVSVEPAEFTLDPGQSQQVAITADVTNLPTGQWAVGAVGFATEATHPGSGLPVAPVRYPLAVVRVDAPATLTVDPAQVTSTQQPDQQVQRTLTLGNTGDLQLQWHVASDQDQPQRLPHRDPTRVATVAPQRQPAAAGGARVATYPGAEPAGTAAAAPPVSANDKQVTLTHSRSLAVTRLNSAACSSSEGFTRDNGYLRTFTLADFGLQDGFEVSEVTFGVEFLDVEQAVSVNLYTLDSQPLVYANMTQIGTAQVTLSPQSATLVSVPVAGSVPADATLVVEIDVPDMQGVGAFVGGSNSAGQTAPSYLRSVACGLPEPADVATLDFPSMHLAMAVTGAPTTPCQLPTGWAAAEPTSGVIAGGEQQQVTLTFDSTGLTPGQYQANLCLLTNDPDRQFTIVPIHLAVDSDGDPGDPSEASQDIVATVPDEPGEGSLVISVDPDDRTVVLPELALADTGDRLETQGQLRPVTVTDTRSQSDPGWDTSAQVGDFASDVGGGFGGGFLGWSPEVVSQSSGQQVAAGGVVAPGFPSGEGLSVPQSLGTAPAGAGVGTAVLGAGLALQLPTDTPPGTYTAVLTLTAI